MSWTSRRPTARRRAGPVLSATFTHRSGVARMRVCMAWAQQAARSVDAGSSASNQQLMASPEKQITLPPKDSISLINAS